jgi:type VI secretion system secreted protein Hcp
MAVDIFLKLGSLTGESQDSTHKNEIDVVAWGWAMSQSGTMHLGTGGGGGKVAVGDLTIFKYTDKATPTIISACASGTHFPTAVLTVRKAGGKAPLEYYKISLQNVLVTGYSTDDATPDQDRFMESVTLNFEAFHVQYQPQGPDGSKLGGMVESKWNIVQNAAA